jgi:HPr kinase/phosphorylase
MIEINKKAIQKRESIDVRFLFENIRSKFNIWLLSDETGFSRLITDQNLHRPGLALAGFVDLFSFSRVQLFGNTEMRYLGQLSEEARGDAIERLFQFSIPCIILTDNNDPFPKLIELANKFHIPIFGSSLSTTKLTYFLSDFLDDQFALRCSMHGSFIDVYGVGIIFVGKSGIGKSEVALDLIERGHRLVSDDVTILTKKGEGIIMGSGTDINKHFMEIRGLGIINVEKMFGVRAIRFQKRLETVVELENWDVSQNYERTGLDGSTVNILGVEIPYVKLPIIPGKNITVISEIIALHYLLKHYGYDAAQAFQDHLNNRLRGNKPPEGRGVAYFEHDFE